MFFILDVDVNELCTEKEKTLNLFDSEINLNNVNYELRSIICFKNRNHFSTFIWKLDSPYVSLFENKFNKNLHYYHDGGMDNGTISYIVKFMPIHIYLFITKKSKIIVFIYY